MTSDAKAIYMTFMKTVLKYQQQSCTQESQKKHNIIGKGRKDHNQNVIGTQINDYDETWKNLGLKKLRDWWKNNVFNF